MQRTEIQPTLDGSELYGANNITGDEFSLFFFHPNDRKFDAVPGWYQRYSAEFDFDDVPILVRPDSLSFEILNWGCGASCAVPDTLVEITYLHYDDNDDFDEGLSGFVQFWLEEVPSPQNYTKLAYDGVDDIDANIVIRKSQGGSWRFDVTMYSITNPADARHAMFRMIYPTSDYFDITDPSRSRLTYEIPESQGGWSYESGLWTLDDIVDYYHFAGAIPEYPEDGSGLIDVAKQSEDMLSCLYFYWEDDAWDFHCDLIFSL